MGIKGFFDVVREQAPDSIYETLLEDFKEKKIAIDISILIYSSFYSVLPTSLIEEDNEFSIDERKLKKNWFSKIFTVIFSLLKYNIEPIFIFDSEEAPKIKDIEKEKRELRKIRLEEVYKETKEKYFESIGNFERTNIKEKYKRSFLNQVRINYSFFSELRDILIKLNFCVFSSIEESDYLIGSLISSDIIDIVFSNDTDLAIYGTNFLIMQINYGRAKVFNLEKFMKITEFKLTEIIDLAILLGNDYNDGIKGVGKKTAFKLIDQYRKLELIPAKYSQKDLNRSIIRKRFTEFPYWKELVNWPKSNFSSFDLEEMKKIGYPIFSSIGLEKKFNEFQNLI